LTKFERTSKVAAADRTQPPYYLKARPSASQKVGLNKTKSDMILSNEKRKNFKELL